MVSRQILAHLDSSVGLRRHSQDINRVRLSGSVLLYGMLRSACTEYGVAARTPYPRSFYTNKDASGGGWGTATVRRTVWPSQGPRIPKRHGVASAPRSTLYLCTHTPTIPTGDPPLRVSLFYYLQFPSAIEQLYRVLCRRSGHVYPRKHTVPITSLLLRFSSLQDRSCSVHLPCWSVRSIRNPRKEASVVRPFPTHLAFLYISSVPIVSSCSKRNLSPPTTGSFCCYSYLLLRGPLVCTMDSF